MNKILLLLGLFCLVGELLSAPVIPETTSENFCSDNDDLLKYKQNTEYVYEYKTNTALWINDVSDESKSSIELSTRVKIRSHGNCKFSLRLEGTTLNGETVNNQNEFVKQLEQDEAVFRLNSEGELHPDVDFSKQDKVWSENIKRGIISAFQLKSERNLRNLDSLVDNTQKSAVVYETDVLGRCRTTYKIKSDGYVAGKSLKLSKSKSLHGCTLNLNQKTSAVQFSQYRSLPEFFQGRLFVEKYECDLTVNDNILSEVSCEEYSTYQRGSKGTKGVQAIAKQTLKFVSSNSFSGGLSSAPVNTESIKFEFTDNSLDNSEDLSLDVDKLLDNRCSRVSDQGLCENHPIRFRSLVKKFETLSKDELLNLYNQAKSKCEVARKTVTQALAFANSENSFEAVLSLLDKDELSNELYITEYPLLTSLARLSNPSREFIDRLRNYVSSKTSKFSYLKKLYLVYTTLVKTYCSNNQCDEAQLDNWGSFLASNLGSNCQDSKNKDLVTTSLKAISNVGYLKNPQVLFACASNNKNSLEVRVNAIQAFRRFSCQQIETSQLPKIIQDSNEDTELRINTFLVLTRCTESEQFQKMASLGYLTQFFEKENDTQLLTFMIDYAKEHGITTMLNAILSNPKLKEKFEINFKEVSWNRFRYRYSVSRDGALESDISVIYTPKTFIPRAIKVNVTLHLYGMSVNFIDAQIRLEGLDEAAKAFIIDRLTSDNFVRKISEKPERLLDILKTLASKLKFNVEKPYLSVSLRVYGADVFYSEYDSSEEFSRLRDFIRNPRESILYKQVNRLIDFNLIDSRVRQPLLNGFEFNTFFDVTGGLYVLKQSSKQQTDDKKTFKIDNFYSLSVAINRKYEILTSQNERLSLKKNANLNLRVKMDATGTKTNGTADYKINLSPLTEIPILKFSGKFFKLTKGSKYTEVTKFNVPRHNFDKCTTSRFRDSFGVDLCVLVDRPAIGSLRDLLKSADLDRSFYSPDDEDDDEDDDDNDEHDGSRPKLFLSGPYDYKITIKNPDLVKSILFKAEFDKEKTNSDQKVEFLGNLKTLNKDSSVQDRLNLIYSRNRHYTNRHYQRSINLELRNAKTNEVRLRLGGDLIYRKKELLNANFVLDNKILRDYNVVFNASREVVEGNVVPTYKVVTIYSSKVLQTRDYRFNFDVTPSGKDIKSTLKLDVLSPKTDNQVVKVVDAVLNLKHANSENTVDYEVDLQWQTKRPSKLSVNGNVLVSLFKSNVDLSVNYNGPRITLPSPLVVRAGHYINGQPGARSNAYLHLTLPISKVNHGVKVIFGSFIEANRPIFRVNYLEAQLNTPSTAGNKPYSLFYSKSISEVGDVTTTEYSYGLRNVKIDLSSRQSAFATALTKLDNDPIVKSFDIEFKRIKNKNAHSSENALNVKKNSAVFVNFASKFYGNLKELRKGSGELSKQSLGGMANVKVLDYSGGFDSSINVESSVKRSYHSLSINFKTDNFVKILSKISSISADIEVNAGKIKSQFEMQKLGDVRSFKLSSNGNLRANGASKEFDVDYEKNLASGDVLNGKGVAKFTWTNFKNFESSLEVKEHMNYKLVVKNERDNADSVFGLHDFYFRYAHLDYQPTEREFKVFINDNTENSLKTFTFNVNAKRGTPNTLDNLEQLSYLVDISTQNTLRVADGNEKLNNGKNQVLLRSKTFNVDIDTKFNYDVKSDVVTADVSLLGKYPAIFSDPGKLNILREQLTYRNELAKSSKTINFQFETDSKILGKRIKSLNVDYTNQNKKTFTFDIKYKTAADENKTAFIQLKLEKAVARLTVKQQAKPQLNSYILGGKTIDISDCLIEGGFNRVKETNNYLLETSALVKCNNVKLTDNLLSITRYSNKKTNNVPHLNVKINAESDIYYGRRSLALNHQKFTREQGSSEISIIRKDVSYSKKFSYSRQLDAQTGKLVKGTYQYDTNFGDLASKSCQLNIEVKNNYYNKLSCTLKSQRLEKAQVNYGYLLIANDHKEMAFGKRDVQLDLNLPGRTLRFEYKGQKASPIDTTDDDDDDNNEREFNSTVKYFWDYSNDQNKYYLAELKRDNYARGKSKFYLILRNNVNGNAYRFDVNRERLFNQTNIDVSLSYALKNGVNNRLDLITRLSSDLDSNSFSFEANLQRPSFNTYYSTKYDKNNARLQHLTIRVAKLISVVVDKEYDPENRRISFQFANPDEAKYSVDSESKFENGVFTVVGNLRQSGSVLSTLTSRFDSNNNNFNVELNAVKSNQQYKFNFGVYNETLANSVLLHASNNNLPLAATSLQILNQEVYNELVYTARFNRFWGQIQRAILGEQVAIANENDKYNSYLGDVYAVLSNDLKEHIDLVKKERKLVREDIKKFGLLLADFYSNYLPEATRNNLKSKVLALDSSPSQQDLPLYKRVFARYNSVARKLTDLHLRVRKYSKRLAKYIPRLPVISYNQDENSKFANNIVITRPTLNAYNLYQFNAEYRNYVKKFGDKVQLIKNTLTRDLKGVGIRGLINKYKYRSLRSFTIVGHIYNKRNVIAYNGESTILRSKCRYLLAHELNGNEFTVILNNNDSPSILSVFARGQPSVDISYDRALVNNKQVALPYNVDLKEKGSISVQRTAQGVCVNVDDDLRVCCYKDSNSCTVALTRWYSGRVAGLLGRSNLYNDNVPEDYWFVDSTCKLSNFVLKKPTQEAVKTCYSLFGKQRKSAYRNAFTVVEPKGWQKVCESVLTADPKGKCPLQRAFVNHARIKSVDLDEPNECFQCNIKDKKFNIGQAVPEESNNSFENGADYVFVLLPCDKKKYALDLTNSFKKIQAKSSSDRFYFVKVDKLHSSIYQAENSNVTTTTDIRKASLSLLDDKTSSDYRVESFYEGLYLAGTLFSNRLAQARHLIIVGCGNCLPYSAIKTLKLERRLESRNIVVSSWDEYDIKSLDSDPSDEEIPIGYGNGKVFLFNKNKNSVDSDDLDSYKLEHSGNLCHRLALKTEGYIFNVNYLKRSNIFDGVIVQAQKAKRTFENRLQRCERVDTPFGDVDDFSYKRREL